MCITFFKVGIKDRVKFVIAFNRDEGLDREAEPLGFHKEFQNIICGLDVKTGTSWLALNKSTGDFAALTNYRTIKEDLTCDYSSRGNLILEYVKIRDKAIKNKKYQSLE